MSALENKISAAVLKMIRARRAAVAASEIAQPAQSSAMIVPAKLREARFSDFSAVAELKQRWGLNADSIENWERLWRCNPALGLRERGLSGLGLKEIERPIGWVLEADGAVVGYLGNISLLYRYGDRELTAVTAHGLVVDPPYRAMGVTLVAAFFRQKGIDLFVSTSAIEAVGKIALAFKSSRLPQPDYETALFWVLRPYSFARGLMKKLELDPAPARIGSIVAALAIGANKIVCGRWPRRASTSFTIDEIGIDHIGDDFQTLWNEKQKKGCRLLADRSPATLRWHFEIPGDRGCVRVLCCYNNGELAGYAVVRSDTNQENGLRTSIIADLVARNDDPEVVRALWVAAYDHARDAGSDTLEVLGFPPAIRGVGAEWNPYRRKYPACPFYYKAADTELHKTLADGAAWYASPFDGDATLIRPSSSSSSNLTTSKMQLQKEDAGKFASNIFEQEHTEVF
jgi:hypothetical protein